VHSDTQNYVYQNEVYEVQYNKFYLVTDKELNNLQKTEKLIRLKIKRIHPDYLELEDNFSSIGRILQVSGYRPRGILVRIFRTRGHSIQIRIVRSSQRCPKALTLHERGWRG